jgi:3-oxoacyl-[acyl-carrier protein] reductase
MQIIRGKKAIVTGAASGIGRCIALALAREGADLFLVDVNEADLKITAREARERHGIEVATAVCDLIHPGEISATVNALQSTWPTFNILVNSAGVSHYGPIHQMTDEEWDRIIAVNLLAPVQLIRALLPTLLASDDAYILNVCSMCGVVPARKIAAYQTAKFGLVGFSHALRAEYDRPDFGVTALCPGFVKTSLMDTIVAAESFGKRRAAIFSWVSTTPEKVAAKALRAIRKRKGLVLLTPTARFFWWLMRLSPTLIDWLNREGWRRRRKPTFSK